MRKLILVSLVLLLVFSIGVVGCAPAAPPAPPPPPAPVAPKVTVDRWEPALVLPWTSFELPAKLQAALPKLLPGVPNKNEGVMGIYYIVAIENPNPYEVMLKELNFNVAFKDTNTGKYFDVGYTPNTKEEMWIPAKKTNYVRIAHLAWSRALATALISAYGHELPVKEGVPDTEVILKGWWADIADMKLAMKIDGQAFFSSAQGDITSTFTAAFPK